MPLNSICAKSALQELVKLTDQAGEDDPEFARAVLSNREVMLRAWCR